MELKSKTHIPTYHVLYGQKVTVRYSGQKQTCGRCFSSADMCMGGGIAKKCEIAGGQKKEFSDYMLEMWQNIQYSPGEIEIASLYDEIDEGLNLGALSVDICESVYTPPKTKCQPSMWGGISVKNFPRDEDQGNIMVIHQELDTKEGWNT